MKKSVAESPAPPTAPVSAPVLVQESTSLRARLLRFFIFIGGILATHFVLYAPSLVGQKILLPLDTLSYPGVYLPPTAEYAGLESRHPALSDEVIQFEFQRRFAAEEFRAGRVPLWDPYHYCGAPFVFPYFSLFNVPYYIFLSPVAMAWSHVLAALVAGGGAYLFFRRVLGVAFWPAVVAAWCFPLTGFFQFWLGFYLSFTASFFPWLLVAVDAVVRRPGGWGAPLLAVITAGLLLSGAADLAGQALLASGLFALWQLWQRYRGERNERMVAAVAAALAGGWVLGFLLAAPWLLALLEYLPSGLRMQRRAGNITERPPVGLYSLPQMVLPLFYGSTEAGWLWLSPTSNLQESGGQAYSGLFAALVLAPLGLASPRLRSLNLFWVLVGILSAAWVLNLWPLVTILQLPGLNLMSHNRFLFVLSFAILSLAATGLDAILRGEVDWQCGYRLPALLAAAFAVWCILSHSALWAGRLKVGADSSVLVKGTVLMLFGVGILTGGFLWLMSALAREKRTGFLIPVVVLTCLGIWCLWRAVDVENVIPDVGVQKAIHIDDATARENKEAEMLISGRANLQRYSIEAAVICGLGISLWLLAWRAPARLASGIIGVAMVAEVLWVLYGQNPEFDPALYYPPVAPLTKLAERVKTAPGRISGFSCLPPLIPQAYGLYDVRGYDAVDPARLVSLCLAARYRGAQIINYALMQYWVPAIGRAPDGTARVIPILNALNFRYLVGRGKPSEIFKPLLIHEDDYWVYENPDWLPRVYVPAHVEVLSQKRVLGALTDANTGVEFDARKLSYVESDLGLSDQCRGSGEIIGETPQEVRIAFKMETPGLLVLADQWYDGWKAYLDGKAVPVVPVNYAVRGVRLPAGSGEVVFRYEPAGWARGMLVFRCATVVLAGWVLFSGWLRWAGRRSPQVA